MPQGIWSEQKKRNAVPSFLYIYNHLYFRLPLQSRTANNKVFFSSSKIKGLFYLTTQFHRSCFLNKGLFYVTHCSNMDQNFLHYMVRFLCFIQIDGGLNFWSGSGKKLLQKTKGTSNRMM